MPATRILSEFVFRSGSGTNAYYFTLSVDEQGVVSMRNITTPTGLIMDSATNVPQSVITDISDAVTQVEDILAATSAVNGSVTFTAETSKAVVFATAMAGTTYRVYVESSAAYVPFRVTSKTVNGFSIEAGITFTGTVRYDVFV